MANQKVLDEVVTKVNELLAQSPVKDVEKNLRVMLGGVFTRLDLVTREEFEVQQEVLKRAREKLTALETRVTALESAAKKSCSRCKMPPSHAIRVDATPPKVRLVPSSAYVAD